MLGVSGPLGARARHVSGRVTLSLAFALWTKDVTTTPLSLRHDSSHGGALPGAARGSGRPPPGPGARARGRGGPERGAGGTSSYHNSSVYAAATQRFLKASYPSGDTTNHQIVPPGEDCPLSPFRARLVFACLRARARECTRVPEAPLDTRRTVTLARARGVGNNMLTPF